MQKTITKKVMAASATRVHNAVTMMKATAAEEGNALWRVVRMMVLKVEGTAEVLCTSAARTRMRKHFII